uniref:Uncharacterized protein n=1 Tax=Aliivibrio wodanis TaxID=80852 RepID=A0A5Q4ZNM1_9GAMM|nr:hypothetical protein AW0309160_01177 [Aliivibrio wodanis]
MQIDGHHTLTYFVAANRFPSAGLPLQKPPRIDKAVRKNTSSTFLSIILTVIR